MANPHHIAWRSTFHGHTLPILLPFTPLTISLLFVKTGDISRGLTKDWPMPLFYHCCTAQLIFLTPEKSLINLSAFEMLCNTWLHNNMFLITSSFAYERSSIFGIYRVSGNGTVFLGSLQDFSMKKHSNDHYLLNIVIVVKMFFCCL